MVEVDKLMFVLVNKTQIIDNLFVKTHVKHLIWRYLSNCWWCDGLMCSRRPNGSLFVGTMVVGAPSRSAGDISWRYASARAKHIRMKPAPCCRGGEGGRCAIRASGTLPASLHTWWQWWFRV